MGLIIDKSVLVVEGVKLIFSLVKTSRPSATRSALDEMEKTHPRLITESVDSAPRGGEVDLTQGHPLEKVGSTPTLAKKTPTASPYAQTSQPDYSGISQISAAGKGCLACGSDHLSSATAALSEAIRFAKTGDIIHPEVVSRITLAMDELNAFERIDGAPEKVTKLPPNEKKMMDDMMAASRNIRHHITDIQTPQDLEKVAALARQYRIEFMSKQMKMQKGT